MLSPGTPENLGAHNRKVILDCIRKSGPLSRADLSRLLEMSFPSISSNIKKLLASNYLREAGAGNNELGRKSVMLQFNANWGYIIGADIGRSQIRVMLSDLEGKEIAYLKEDYVAVDGVSVAQECLLKLIESVIRDGGISPAQVKHISIGITGILNPKTGKLMLVPFMPQLNINEIVNHLESKYASPIFVENSVNLGAIGEKWQGTAKGYKDILYLSYGVGIGSALILNGELYRGANNAAGEIGFMVPDISKMREEFDEQGVLESLVSGNRIQNTLINNGLTKDLNSLLWENENSNPAAQELIKEIYVYIGIMLINTVSLINLELIVIGGRLGEFLSSLLIPEWHDLLSRHVPFVPEIHASSLREKASVLGGIAIGMRYVSDTLVEQVY